MLGKGDEVMLSNLTEFKEKYSLDINLQDDKLVDVLTTPEIIQLLKKIKVKQIFLFKDQKPETTATAKSPIIYSHFIDGSLIFTTRVSLLYLFPRVGIFLHFFLK